MGYYSKGLLHPLIELLKYITASQSGVLLLMYVCNKTERKKMNQYCLNNIAFTFVVINKMKFENSFIKYFFEKVL